MMNYTPEELKKIHDAELKILIELQRICEKHNIEYFAACGTTLGAIRHNGFIPWDDDIDVGMTRDNYDKFLKVVKQELSSEFFFQDFNTDPKCPFYFSKIRLNNTLFVERYLKDIKMHHGIYLDIFPYDKVPEKSEQQKKFFRKVKVLHQIYIAKSVYKTCNPQTTLSGKIMLTGRFALHILLLIVPKKYLYRKLDALIQKYNTTDSQIVAYIPDPKSKINIKYLYPIKTVQFEHVKINVPNNSDVYLKSLYGDYMTLPPIEKRHGHRPYKIKF